MDERQFDRLTRRFVLGSLAAALGLGRAPIPHEVSAKKRKKRRVKRNAFGCVNVGDFCRNAGQCCSGNCKGKKDKSKCVAHHVGGCTIGQDVCLGVASTCGTVSGSSCFRTTGKASFCGVRDQSQCVDCTKDTDCEAAFGSGAACLVCDDCVMVGGNTACIAPGV